MLLGILLARPVEQPNLTLSFLSVLVEAAVRNRLKALPNPNPLSFSVLYMAAPSKACETGLS